MGFNSVTVWSVMGTFLKKLYFLLCVNKYIISCLEPEVVLQEFIPKITIIVNKTIGKPTHNTRIDPSIASYFGLITFTKSTNI